MWVSFTDVYLGVWVNIGAVLQMFHKYSENLAIQTALSPISPVMRGITVLKYVTIHNLWKIWKTKCLKQIMGALFIAKRRVIGSQW